jgi:septum formation inhibitor-activating ATPase MinD
MTSLPAVPLIVAAADTMVAVRPPQLRACVEADALVGISGTRTTRAAAVEIIDVTDLLGRFRMSAS